MGKYLQIRVSAGTFDPADVEKNYPRLCRVAWEDNGRPTFGEPGVFNLVERLEEVVRFGDLDPTVKGLLRDGVQRAFESKMELEAALADWDPRRADKISYELEDRLLELEKSLPRD